MLKLTQRNQVSIVLLLLVIRGIMTCHRCIYLELAALVHGLIGLRRGKVYCSGVRVG
jgi:hypothetical protein